MGGEAGRLVPEKPSIPNSPQTERRAPRFDLSGHELRGSNVGSEELHVSIAGDGPKVFGAFTGDLERLRDWFQEQGVPSVAMEATGVYWLYLYEVLEAAGLEAVVVNERHVQNMPGRKTDMADCQWLATPHAHGLLRGSFVPPADIRRLQDY
jgi:hypothetical protein